ncbi:MAG: beta-ketoacyl synthase chain length factor [Bacteroidetes bacterium]|nr:beta-ketoacyl synthase chain length factor [Bacteroidota bacterium]
MVHINGIGSISVQNQERLTVPDISETHHIRCQDPDFSAFIPPMIARRMSKIIKRAIVSSKLALTDAGLDMPDAIISGTGLGCIEDTEKFLTAMIQNNETLLQPTHFIQSTHNTISSQIAMQLKCYGYNNTYSHLGISFESALLDAFLQLKTNACKNVLVGGYDEMTSNYYLMLSKLGFWNHCFSGEGCTSLILANQQTENTYCKIEAVHLFYAPKSNSDIQNEIDLILKNTNLEINDIDLVITGKNGNSDNDLIYNSIYTDGLHLPQLTYKQFSGEYFTASAFGIALAAKILKTQTIHEPLINRNDKVAIRSILFHQHFHNQAHALILLSSC